MRFSILRLILGGHRGSGLASITFAQSISSQLKTHKVLTWAVTLSISSTTQIILQHWSSIQVNRLYVGRRTAVNWMILVFQLAVSLRSEEHTSELQSHVN